MARINGDAAANRLRGTGDDDEIFGLGRSDRLLGLAGDDLLEGGDDNDLLRGFRGNDTLKGGNGADQLEGGDDSDKLEGGEGNDILDGGKGRDEMAGGQGDDTYWVDNRSDRIIERRNQGIDTVQAAIGYTLGNNLENLTLVGTRSINGTGNGLNNFITGNNADNVLRGLGGSDRLGGGEGNDQLDGGEGSDLLFGGAGDDLYMVENGGDRLSEDINQGIDTVQSAVDFALGDNFENLILVGGALVGKGNALANVVTGNALNNSLDGGDGADKLLGEAGDDVLVGGNGADDLTGGAGSDRLTGGGGPDQFIYATGRAFAIADVGIDTIIDFTRTTDVIALSRQTFGLSSSTGTPLSASEFQAVDRDGLADNSAALIVFSKATGKLFYNPNGTVSGFGAVESSGHFLTLNATTSLAATDFVVVA
jgi:Ca2+-binding RTX toxin-like protein